MAKKAILIDGNSLIYRAFYALPLSLATSSGQVTNAVYGFTSMLIKLLKEEKPDAIAVAFDRPAPTFRHEQFEEYKAHRPPMPDELKSQFPLVKEILEALGIPVFEMDGYEADDIIGTITKLAEREGFETIIVTGDKDAYQLISPQTRIMSTKKGITDIVIYDREKVIERYGLPPEKMIEMLSLKGDASDNIPGVPGIGDKIASRLIQEFGSLEEVLANVDKVKGQKIQEALREYADQARLSRELATLHCQVPVEFNMDEMKPRLDKDKAREVFSSLQFDTLIKRLEIETTVEAATEEQRQLSLLDAGVELTSVRELSAPKVNRVTNVSELAELIRQLERKPEMALAAWPSNDTVNAVNKAVAIALSPEETWLIDLQGDILNKKTVLDKLRPFLESEKQTKAVYDAKSHYIRWQNDGIVLKGLDFDVMLAAYLIDPGDGKYSISKLAEKYLGKSVSDEVENCGAFDESRLTQKAAAVWRLKPVLSNRLGQDGLLELFDQIEMPLARVLARMELAGVGVDIDVLGKLSRELEGTISHLEQEVCRETGSDFNLNSPQQLGLVLFEKLQLPAEKKTKTGYSTDSSVLLKLRPLHPVIEKILEYRELTKLKSTYIDALPKLINAKTGRIHTSFNQTGTLTGRLSSSNPNLQNIPVRTEVGRKIREAFIPTRPDDELLVADYSQIELRLLAHLSGDEALIRFFEEDKDIHNATAAEVFGVDLEEVTPELRRRAKAVNFGIIYGISSYGLAEQLGISGKEAKGYIDQYFNRFPAVKRYREKAIETAYREGFVRTMLGRKRALPELRSPIYSLRNFGERLAINTPLQGTAADIIKMAMIRIDQKIEEKGLASRMVLQVHDELVFEVPPREKEDIVDLVRREMENAFPLKVRLKVDIAVGYNWREAK